jgi:solute carrier family 25 folate transporter 32
VLEGVDNEFLVHLSSAVTAGACSTIVTNPIWVIKTRLMSQSVFHMTAGHPYDPRAQPQWHYRGTLDAAKKMYMHEGIMSFYSGLSPALLGLTHVAVQFPAYEFLRRKFTGKAMGDLSDDESDKTWTEVVGVLGASVISKVMASSATYPHEVIRTRLQTQRRPVAGEHFLQGMGITPDATRLPGQMKGELKYKGVVRTFRTILQEEGWRAFYAGMGTNMMRAVPAATVTMFTYEYFMGEFRRIRQSAKQKTEGFDGHASL